MRKQKQKQKGTSPYFFSPFGSHFEEIKITNSSKSASFLQRKAAP